MLCTLFVPAVHSLCCFLHIISVHYFQVICCIFILVSGICDLSQCSRSTEGVLCSKQNRCHSYNGYVCRWRPEMARRSSVSLVTTCSCSRSMYWYICIDTWFLPQNFSHDFASSLEWQMTASLKQGSFYCAL